MMPIACGLVGWYAGQSGKNLQNLTVSDLKIVGRKIHARNQFSIVAVKILKTKSDFLF